MKAFHVKRCIIENEPGCKIDDAGSMFNPRTDIYRFHKQESSARESGKRENIKWRSIESKTCLGSCGFWGEQICLSAYLSCNPHLYRVVFTCRLVELLTVTLSLVKSLRGHWLHPGPSQTLCNVLIHTVQECLCGSRNLTSPGNICFHLCDFSFPTSVCANWVLFVRLFITGYRLFHEWPIAQECPRKLMKPH